MAIRNIRRQATNPGGVSGTTNSAPIYVDSDDNILKIIPAGSGTTEVQIIDATSAQTISGVKTFTGNVILSDVTFEIGDDDRLTLGDDNDSVILHRAATLAANTALTDVLVGTPVTQALAANSTIVSNVTASGDVLIAANRGGASEEYVFADASAGTLTLTGPGGVVNIESGTTQVLGINSATVIEVGDDINFTLGADNDGVLRHKTTSTAANTAVTGAIVGTPVVPALAANSVILSDITADGDIAILTQTGGNSQAALTVDASAGQVDLYAAGVSKLTVDSTGVRSVVSSEVVTTTNVITAAESGRVFILNSATAFVSTLPSPALGLNFVFVIGATPPSGGNHTVVTTGATNIIYGSAEVAGAIVAASAEDSINFIDGGLPGDYVEVVSDGTNYYVRGVATTAGKLTFTAV